MIKVITYGTFDLFHYGHLKILERAKELGDYLIVAVSTDEFNATKHKANIYPYQHRSEIVKAIEYVDEVIPENSWEQKTEDIITKNIDVFVMGSDWEGEFDSLSKHCKVVYLPRTENISSTQIKDSFK
ncbi:MAG: glycerol-3-phosphate cytidylyltransferase [Melioribacteraceae bacterium]|nr:glycerol-3-phosphate cytidylyltransferase [Melioribacteraceae bacterium]